MLFTTERVLEVIYIVYIYIYIYILYIFTTIYNFEYSRIKPKLFVWWRYFF